MSEAIAFPDAEALAIVALKAALPDVPVSTRVPSERPDEFIRVVRVGGTRSHLVSDNPMLTIECWSTDTVKASDLARRARAHVGAMAQTTINGAWVRSVREVGGPMSFPDPVTESPRYQFTVLLDVRGDAL